MKTKLCPRLASVMLFACVSLGAVRAQAPQLPPLFRDVKLELLPARSVAELPPNNFLENLVFDGQGRAYVTSHEDGVVYRYRAGGRLESFARVPGKVAGIALHAKRGLLVAGADASGRATVFAISLAGHVSVVGVLPGAVFLNGLAQLDGDTYLIADSYKGVIWRFDANSGRSSEWLAHPLLTRADEKNPLPAANGLKVRALTVWVSNTSRQTLLTIGVDAQGNAGAPRVARDSVNIDDFVIDDDGTLYGTTHVYNSLIRIAPDGTLSTVATAEQGMIGSTAVAFGRVRGDRRRLYVTTNGGMFMPPPGGVQPARLVQIDAGALRSTTPRNKP
jgi:outer membrane protein assembly factor BamB